jgi:hypothetical protein
MGPGTHIVDNINNKLQPINEVDHTALHHDIDYIRANGSYSALLKSDLKAIANSGFTPSGLLMKQGLLLRTLLSTLTFNKINFGGKTLSTQEANLLADYLDNKHQIDYHLQKL